MTQSKRAAERKMLKAANLMVTRKGWLIDGERNISINAFLRRRTQFEVAVLEYRATLARQRKGRKRDSR